MRCGRAGEQHDVANHVADPQGLRANDRQHLSSGRILFVAQQLARAADDGSQRIVDLVTGGGCELREGFQTVRIGAPVCRAVVSRGWRLAHRQSINPENEGPPIGSAAHFSIRRSDLKSVCHGSASRAIFQHHSPNSPRLVEPWHTRTFNRLDAGGGFHIEQFAHPLDEGVDLERLLEEVVGTSSPQIGDLVLLDHPRDADDTGFVER